MTSWWRREQLPLPTKRCKICFHFNDCMASYCHGQHTLRWWRWTTPSEPGEDNGKARALWYGMLLYVPIDRCGFQVDISRLDGWSVKLSPDWYFRCLPTTSRVHLWFSDNMAGIHYSAMMTEPDSVTLIELLATRRHVQLVTHQRCLVQKSKSKMKCSTISPCTCCGVHRSTSSMMSFF